MVEQNAPNQFNISITIDFHHFVTGPLQLEIYDVAGQRLRVINLGVQPAETYPLVWDGRDQHGASVASGIYFYRTGQGSVDLAFRGFMTTRKMLLLK
tara:strand:- start:316 stop:606 length:291 start_codon:yes stop_codon:yes gene_type:complete